jgi:hypothetical protein
MSLNQQEKQMTRMPRYFGGKGFAAREWGWSLIFIGIFLTICWWLPTILGFPFYLLYVKVFGWTLSSSESFWVTLALTFLVLLLIYFIRRVTEIVRG